MEFIWKIINWVSRLLQDDSGNPSSKRVIAFLSFVLFSYVAIDGDEVMARVVAGVVLLALGITIPDKFSKK